MPDYLKGMGWSAFFTKEEALDAIKSRVLGYPPEYKHLQAAHIVLDQNDIRRYLFWPLATLVVSVIFATAIHYDLYGTLIQDDLVSATLTGAVFLLLSSSFILLQTYLERDKIDVNRVQKSRTDFSWWKLILEVISFVTGIAALAAF
jgi:hypothetical protein